MGRFGGDAGRVHPFEGLLPLFPIPTGEFPAEAASYTYHQATGNRLIAGQADLLSARVVEMTLPEQAQWIVGYPVGLSSVWVVVLADGQNQAYMLTGDVIEMLTPAFQPYSQPSPPALGLIDDSIQLMFSPPAAGSLLTHPILLPFFDTTFASHDTEGKLVLWEQGRITHLLVDVLPDSRLLHDEQGRILALTKPSTDYPHGILGDALEATCIALVETKPCAQVLTEIPVPSPFVIEGLSPIWADLDGSGSREILVTVSDLAQGARLLAYAETGELLAQGPPVGRGFRWRHQLAVAPFGPKGEIEIATVLTPHIGGVVEFYRLIEDRLEVVARVPGYSTHLIRSRNMDMALAGDFDADGKIELLAPNQQFNTLGGIRRTIDGAQVTWTIPVGGRISTNLAAACLADDTLVLAVGRKDRVLRLWLP